MLKKDKGNEVESSFSQSYTIWRNNGLPGMIESIPPKNPEVEQSQVTKEWPRRKRIDNEGAVRKVQNWPQQ